MASREEIVTIISILNKDYGQTMLARLSSLGAYKMLIATILSARARDEATEVLALKLFKKYKTISDLSNASLSELERDVRSSGFYKQKAYRIKETSKQIIGRFSGKVPDNMNDLISLPGVGRKTAGCVLVYHFRKPAIPVDTHVHKLSNRLGWVSTNSPLKTEIELLKIVPKSKWALVNDLFVHHGKTVCKSPVPLCSSCEISKYCKRVGVTKSK